MNILSKLSILLVVLSTILMITNHQGVAQKVIQASFLLVTISLIIYIFDLRKK